MNLQQTLESIKVLPFDSLARRQRIRELEKNSYWFEAAKEWKKIGCADDSMAALAIHVSNNIGNQIRDRNESVHRELKANGEFKYLNEQGIAAKMYPYMLENQKTVENEFINAHGDFFNGVKNIYQTI